MISAALDHLDTLTTGRIIAAIINDQFRCPYCGAQARYKHQAASGWCDLCGAVFVYTGGRQARLDDRDIVTELWIAEDGNGWAYLAQNLMGVA